MTIWHIHMLNARNALTPIMAEARAAARRAVALAETHFDLPRFDLVLRAADRPIADGGLLARPPERGVIDITLSPDRVTAPVLNRALMRELHHVARHEGAGYGRSLGEVLVSEGLAAHFAARVLALPPDPREAARPAGGSLKQVSNLWSRHDFGFEEWFLGRGRIRKGTGYAIGHRLVGQWLGDEGPADPAAMLALRADALRPALRRLMAAEGVEEEDAPEDAPQDAPEADLPTGDTPAGEARP